MMKRSMQMSVTAASMQCSADTVHFDINGAARYFSVLRFYSFLAACFDLKESWFHEYR